MPLMEPADPAAFVEQLRSLRQTRRFTDEPVADNIVEDILQVARWTGSAKNTQPWHFVVVDDADVLQQLADAGPFATFLAGAPLAIVIAMAGSSARTEPYDEGRVTERMMLAADAHGLGSGTGWFGPDDDGENKVKQLLGIPQNLVVRQALGIGHPEDAAQRVGGVQGGRKPLDEIVSRGTYGS
jgi:nitroreductase